MLRCRCSLGWSTPEGHLHLSSERIRFAFYLSLSILWASRTLNMYRSEQTKESLKWTPCHCDASQSLSPRSIDHPGGSATQEGTNVLHGVTKKYAIGLQGDIAQVGRNYRVL